MSDQDYRAALRVAIESATAAAGLLRAACRQPGGPGGSLGHCPTDQEAEQLVRTRLSGAFPEWGYRGEETRPHVGPRDPAAHVWIVDPNDGTSAMQQGFRGHAVSIGLLRGGVPVLGVVCAPTAPDDGGDLITWAEGCGPLTRNGRTLEPPAWPHALTASAIVLVSQDADRHPNGNLACVAPARFGDVPSIAYRLALVAAGDAVAGVSLNGPGDWDYCAGHALLRGVGGTLVDERGQEVSYDRDGRSSTAACFGGAPDIVRHLAGQNWQRVWGSGFGAAEPPPGYKPARLRPGQQVHDVAVLRRAHGCLLGQVAGDALGSLVEFQEPGAIARQYPHGPRGLVEGGVWDTMAGQPTDDSGLALMLARTLLDRQGFDLEAVATACARWFHGWAHSDRFESCEHAWCRPFDYGRATARAFGTVNTEAVQAGRAATTMMAAADQDPGNQPNGALMRISPLGVWGWCRPADEVAEAARTEARLSHPSPVCQEASAVFTVALAGAIHTGGTRDDVYQRTCEWAHAACRERAVIDALDAAGTQPPRQYTHQQGWVLTALQNAFFQLVHAPSFEEGVVRTVQAGGDTDTNAAICGALLGAVEGREAAPGQWRRMVTSCRPLAGHPGVHRPRPAMVWPADVLTLAERLVLVDQRPA